MQDTLFVCKIINLQVAYFENTWKLVMLTANSTFLHLQSHLHVFD